MSNKALGISGGSRVDAKTAISDDAYAELRAAIEDDGLRAMIALERHLGLRAMEAIRSRDRLDIWERQLREGETTRWKVDSDPCFADEQKTYYFTRSIASWNLSQRQGLIQMPPPQIHSCGRDKCER